MYRFLVGVAVLLTAVHVQASAGDYALGPGDVVRITVFQNPELTTETRVSELGTITFPLIGEVRIGGLSTSATERLIAQKLSEGNYLSRPNVNVMVAQFRSLQVSVLGQVNRPGKYPLEQSSNMLTEVLALAGGISPNGGDLVTVVRRKGNQEQHIEVDVSSLIRKNNTKGDIEIQNGDIVYVPRYPVFYIYGEVQRPGQFRLERDMTIMQALAQGGGLTQRGSERGLRIGRRNGEGKHILHETELSALLLPDDVVYVKETFF